MSTTATVSMLFALRACVLICVDRQPGEWFSVARICQHVGALQGPAVERVRNVLQQLTESGQVQHASAAGVDFYGVGCDGVPVPQPEAAKA